MFGRGQEAVESPAAAAEPTPVPPQELAPPAAAAILDQYVLAEPTDQNIVDIFANEWSSRFPASSDLVTRPGAAGLFEDERVLWAQEKLGSFEGRQILELGPLEGGHSYMFQQAGAERVIAIEANTRAFLKCLCVKEIFDLDRVEFKLGDFMSYLEKADLSYDMVFASGVLYHMEDPLLLLDLMSRVSDRLFLWTHYYDAEPLLSREDYANKFEPVQTAEHQGFRYEYSTQSYQHALDWSGFCGGPKTVSKWLTRESIEGALRHLGYTSLHVAFDERDHPNGPSFAICAVRE